MADLPRVRDWVQPLLGNNAQFPERRADIRFRQVADQPPKLPKAERIPVRMPSRAEKAELVGRFGHACAFCGIPLVRSEVRAKLTQAYPAEAYWGRDCHAALLCMWLQFDHVLPHSRGGDNSLENLVVTCSGCNYGRMSYTLEELGLIDPRATPIRKTDWDGLERLLAAEPRL
jgi:5-methylcytosine-specific restriction endonuclease McrA